MVIELFTNVLNVILEVALVEFPEIRIAPPSAPPPAPVPAELDVKTLVVTVNGSPSVKIAPASSSAELDVNVLPLMVALEPLASSMIAPPSPFVEVFPVKVELVTVSNVPLL